MAGSEHSMCFSKDDEGSQKNSETAICLFRVLLYLFRIPQSEFRIRTYSFHPWFPISGTNTQGMLFRVTTPSDVLTTLTSVWVNRSPTGMTILPPTASWSTRVWGTSGEAAVTIMASKGAI